MSTNNESLAAHYDATTKEDNVPNASGSASTTKPNATPLRSALYGNPLVEDGRSLNDDGSTKDDSSINDGSSVEDNRSVKHPLAGRICRGVSATHSRLKNDPRKDLRELYIDPPGTRRDVYATKKWVVELGVLPQMAKFYYHSAKPEGEGDDRATVEHVLMVFDHLPANMFTIVYVALHTEVEGNSKDEHSNRAFLAADYTGDDIKKPDSLGVIPYSVITQRLSSALRDGSSIMLLTETCFSINIMSLPYKCWVTFIEDKPQVEWEEIDFSNKRSPIIFTKREWGSKPLTVQSAATTPEGAAAHFGGGAVYTRALHDVMSPASRDCAASFQDFMINIQRLMNVASRHPSFLSKLDPQVHVLYCSRKIENNEDFWLAFEPKSPNSPADSER